MDITDYVSSDGLDLHEPFHLLCLLSNAVTSHALLYGENSTLHLDRKEKYINIQQIHVNLEIEVWYMHMFLHEHVM